MTEKVKITQKQADAINELIKTHSELRINEAHEQLIKEKLDYGSKWSHEEFEAANTISPIDFIDALRIGYEIEPEYKVGDWVITSGHVAKIIAIQYENKRVQYDSISNWQPIKGIDRHATPEEIKAEKERQKWAKIEEGDVLRKIPMAHEIAIYQGGADDVSILVKNDSGQHLWKKSQVELYAKKVGEAK